MTKALTAYCMVAMAATAVCGPGAPAAWAGEAIELTGRAETADVLTQQHVALGLRISTEVSRQQDPQGKRGWVRIINHTNRYELIAWGPAWDLYFLRPGTRKYYRMSYVDALKLRGFVRSNSFAATSALGRPLSSKSVVLRNGRYLQSEFGGDVLKSTFAFPNVDRQQQVVVGYTLLSLDRPVSEPQRNIVFRYFHLPVSRGLPYSLIGKTNTGEKLWNLQTAKMEVRAVMPPTMRSLAGFAQAKSLVDVTVADQSDSDLQQILSL